MRLESAAGLQPVAEGEKLERGHRLQDVELGDHHLEDGQDPLEGVARAGAVVPREQPLEVVQLVQDLLEPELVDLMDHDEEHLVVLGPLRQGALEREQLIDLQIFGARGREWSPGMAGGVDGTGTA